MRKSHLKILEKVFAKEIGGGYYQGKSKILKELEDEGYVQRIDLSSGAFKAHGYRLTLLGNLTYCTSELCNEP